MEHIYTHRYVYHYASSHVGIHMTTSHINNVTNTKRIKATLFIFMQIKQTPVERFSFLVRRSALSSHIKWIQNDFSTCSYAETQKYTQRIRNEYSSTWYKARQHVYIAIRRIQRIQMAGIKLFIISPYSDYAYDDSVRKMRTLYSFTVWCVYTFSDGCYVCIPPPNYLVSFMEPNPTVLY